MSSPSRRVSQDDFLVLFLILHLHCLTKLRKILRSRKHNNNSIELETKTATCPFWTHPTVSIGKKRVTLLAGVSDPDYQGEIGLLLHNRGNSCFWGTACSWNWNTLRAAEWAASALQFFTRTKTLCWHQASRILKTHFSSERIPASKGNWIWNEDPGTQENIASL